MKKIASIMLALVFGLLFVATANAGKIESKVSNLIDSKLANLEEEHYVIKDYEVKKYFHFNLNGCTATFLEKTILTSIYDCVEEKKEGEILEFPFGKKGLKLRAKVTYKSFGQYRVAILVPDNFEYKLPKGKNFHLTFVKSMETPDMLIARAKHSDGNADGYITAAKKYFKEGAVSLHYAREEYAENHRSTKKDREPIYRKAKKLNLISDGLLKYCEHLFVDIRKEKKGGIAAEGSVLIYKYQIIGVGMYGMQSKRKLNRKYFRKYWRIMFFDG